MQHSNLHVAVILKDSLNWCNMASSTTFLFFLTVNVILVTASTQFLSRVQTSHPYRIGKASALANKLAAEVRYNKNKS